MRGPGCELRSKVYGFVGRGSMSLSDTQGSSPAGRDDDFRLLSGYHLDLNVNVSVLRPSSPQCFLEKSETVAFLPTTRTPHIAHLSFHG